MPLHGGFGVGGMIVQEESLSKAFDYIEVFDDQ